MNGLVICSKKIEFKIYYIYNITIILKMSYIRYIDINKKEIKVNYTNDILEVDLSYKNIKQKCYE